MALGGMVAAVVGAAVLAGPRPARAQSAAVPTVLNGAPTSATDRTPVRLDADIYTPEATPAPAVLLAPARRWAFSPFRLPALRRLPPARQL